MKKLFLNDYFLIALISINTLCIFIQGFTYLDPNFLKFIATIDHFITILFVVEMIIKIRHYGWRGYISSYWNKLDFLLVVISLPSLITLMFGTMGFDMSFLMIFRLLRAFKFFRILRFIPDIDNLVSGSIRALKTSFLVMIAFFILLVISSLFSCFIFGGISPEHFGDPLASMYSIFKIFTIEGWYEIPDEIAGEYSGAYMQLVRAYFIGILFIGGIIGLSLLNSIFVDAMVADNNDELEKKIDELNAKIDQLMEMNK